MDGLASTEAATGADDGASSADGTASAAAASGGAQALQALHERLQRLALESLVEPKVQVNLVLEEARELSAYLGRPSIRERMKSIGIQEQELDELQLAAKAAAEAERLWVLARDQHKTPRQAQAEVLAYSLRDEMVAACRFHLDGVDVLELLARVADGENARDLVQDLRELAAFVAQRAALFATDTSFDPNLCAAEALELSAAMVLDGELSDEALAQLELRDRALTHLCELLDRLRRAGRYAYRGMPEARAYFASGVTAARRRRPLISSVRSLAG
jgi:hypothetical protein